MNREQQEAIQSVLQRHFPTILIFWPVSIWQTSSEHYHQSEQSHLPQAGSQATRPQTVALLGFSFRRAASFLGGVCFVMLTSFSSDCICPEGVIQYVGHRRTPKFM